MTSKEQPSKIAYTHEEVVADLRAIVRDAARDNYRPDCVVGIARGGLVPATMLSHYWAVPLLTINLSLRDGMAGKEPGFGAAITAIKAAGSQALVVDDICDGGETLHRALEELAEKMQVGIEVRSAVLWLNTAQTLASPDYHAREINRDEDERWIVFPWEEW